MPGNNEQGTGSAEQGTGANEDPFQNSEFLILGWYSICCLPNISSPRELKTNNEQGTRRSEQGTGANKDPLQNS